MCLVGTDPAKTKNESDSPSVRPTKRKEPIKLDISVKVVPKPRKVSFFSQNQLLKIMKIDSSSCFCSIRVEKSNLRTKNLELLTRLENIWDCLKQFDEEQKQLDKQEVIMFNLF